MMLSKQDRFAAHLSGAVCFLALILLFLAAASFFFSAAKLLQPLANETLLQLFCLFFCAFTFSVLLGLAAALFFTAVPRQTKFSAPFHISIEFLASLPPAMLGLLGYLFFAQLAGAPKVHAAAFALAFLMFPLMENQIESALEAVPESYKEASKSLGASPLATTLTITLPQAAKGILAGIASAAVRSLGEAAVFMLVASRLEDRLRVSSSSSNQLLQLFLFAWGLVFLLYLLRKRCSFGIRK
jgi:ABC-type phosphate transport system permease subunit